MRQPLSLTQVVLHLLESDDQREVLLNALGRELASIELEHMKAADGWDPERWDAGDQAILEERCQDHLVRAFHHVVGNALRIEIDIHNHLQERLDGVEPWKGAPEDDFPF